MTEIRCISCGRTTVIEPWTDVKGTTERFARRRWMVVEDKRGIYAVVCGGNDKGVIQRVNRNLKRDLFPGPDGDLVTRAVEPGYDDQEIDVCLAKYLEDFKTKAKLCHLFIPDMGEGHAPLGVLKKAIGQL